MVHSQNGNIIQMLLFQSRPHAQGERAVYSCIYILDPNYVFPPPKTPAKCPQQQVSAPSMLSGDCLHMFTYPALPEIPPAHPALPSGTLGTLPAPLRTLFVIPNSPGTKARSLFLGGGEFPVWIYDMVHTSPGY